jgi:hypothetical protein
MPPESLTPSPDSERERAAFEAWAKKNGYELDIDSDSYGWGYMFESTGDAWEGWCGRASLSEYAQTKPIPQELAQVVTDALECGALWTEGSEAHPRMKLALRAFKVWVGGDSSQRSGDGGHSAWLPIDSAPRDGTEILAWREDCGQFMAKWTCVDELRTTSDKDRDELDEDTLFSHDWFCGDSEGNFRADGSEVPTHWQPLPPAPGAGLAQSKQAEIAAKVVADLLAATKWPNLTAITQAISFIQTFAQSKQEPEPTDERVMMPEKAHAGIEVLHRVVDSLLTTSRYVDEEGEATFALADLLACIADPPFRLAAAISQSKQATPPKRCPHNWQNWSSHPNGSNEPWCSDCGMNPLATPPNAPPNASGCDFCRNPLFAGTKCKNCGRNAPPNGEGTASSTSQAPVKQDCKCPQGMYWHRARIEGNSEGTGTNGGTPEGSRNG